jgi:CPA2 family monovalent cation:H+ antiporter-2
VHGESVKLFMDLLLLLGTATTLLILFHRLRLAALLAFIVTGAIYGPSGLAVVTDDTELSAIASLGLSFLLFLLGLEFSLPRLISLRKIVLRLGVSQVLLCSISIAIPLYLWGMPLTTALLLAAGLSLSSTAIVSRELSRMGQLATRHGEIAIGILLLQDLAAVLLLIAVPLLAGQATNTSPENLVISIGSTLILLTLFYLAARYLLPRILQEVARHKSDELLVLTALVIVLLCGTLTSLIGLSMELGAFLAGMMLGESRFRHQLEADIRPFRDFLLGLFFITIGMLIDLDLLANYWPRIILAGITLIVGKAIAVTMIARFFGESWRAAIPAGLALAQGGEFLFAFLALAVADGLIPEDVAAFMISTTIVSMMLTPVIIRHGPSLVDSAILRISKAALTPAADVAELPDLDKQGHVLILGYGRVGQTIARFFKMEKLDYLVLDSDAVRVAECATAGEPVYYGLTTRLDVLKAAGVDKARMVIISFDAIEDTRLVLAHVRELAPDVPVLTRTRDDAHLDELMQLGATRVIPETHEASLTLASHALILLRTPRAEVQRLVDEARAGRYQMLQGFYHGERMNLTLRKNPDGRVLHPVVLTGEAWACGHTAGELVLPESLHLQEVHRRDETIRGDDLQDFELQHGDVLILNGKLDAMVIGENWLLIGPPGKT